MFLSKVLHKPNLVGVIMITLLFGAGFIYAFAFDGFNIEKVTGSEVEVWLASTGDSGSGGDDPPDDGSDPPDDGSDPPDDDTPEDGDEGGPCDCPGVGAPYGDCNCGNQTFKKTKADKKGSWKNPCPGAETSFPCPSCGNRDDHRGPGGNNGHCPCDNHPGYTDGSGNRKRATWTLCKASADYAKKCGGTCKDGIKKK